MANQALSPEALAVIAKVEKLLALAGNNDNEHQAEAATAKAMELLAAYNLDIAVIGKSGKGAQRSDTRLKGGLYGWQRSLWDAVADLNFCLYRSIRGLGKGQVYEHRVIGSHVNVTSTKVMADYLQQTIERLAQEWAKERGYRSVFVREAIAYREGMADRLAERLRRMRYERMRKEREEADKARAADRQAGKEPGTSLVLADVVQTEADLNFDHLHGYAPGTHARWRAENEARRIAAQKAAEEELARREREEAENPLLREARLKQEEQERLEDERRDREWQKREERNARRRKGDGYRYRKATDAELRRSTEEFQSGYERGGDVGLDPQVGRGSPRGLSRGGPDD